MGTWLNFRLHVLLPHYMPLFLVCVFALGFRWHFLDEAVVVCLSAVFVFEDVPLLKDSLHHLARDALVLLVIIRWSWVFSGLLVRESS